MPRIQPTLINPRSTKEKRRELRKPLTEPELMLWQHVRTRQLGGFYFRRQHGVGPYIVDFCCVSARLIVELDGAQHQSAEASVYDSERTKYLESLGYRVLRFDNVEVYRSLDRVLGRILELLSERAPQTSPVSKA